MACLIFVGCARNSSVHSGAPLSRSVQSFSSANPFAVPSSLQYQAPPFNKIGNLDYQPAIEEGMRQGQQDWNTIAKEPTPATFDNTILPLEKSGVLLTRVNRVFGGVVAANTNDTLQQVQTEEAPKLASHYDALYLNPQIFRRVEVVYAKREALQPEQRAVVERYHRDFIRAGAQLTEEQKERLRK